MAKSDKKFYTHILIAVALGLLCRFGIAPTGGITSIGVNVLAVTVATMYLWLTVGTDWTSLLFMGLLIMTGAMTANQVWAGSMGHFSVITMIVFMILNYCLLQTGVINLVCSWFTTRKIVRNRPYVFLFMFFASMMVLGLFMDNLSLAVIYVGITEVMGQKLGLKKGDPFFVCMFMGVMWVCDVISIASPIAHAPCLILMGMMSSQLGITVSYGQWLLLGIPFAILMLGVIMLTVRFWKPDTTAYVNYDVEAEKANMKPLDRKGKLSAVVFILAIALILLPELLVSVAPGFSTYWKTCGVVVPAILAIAVLCIVRVGGAPVLDVKAALKSLPMGAIIFAGVVCVMSTPITSELTGINVWLSNILQPLVSGLSPFLIVFLLCVFALVMTNFLSNVVTMVLFFNIGVALLSGGSVNLGMFSILIGIMSSIACLTPAACAPMPLVFGPGHVTMQNTVRPNLFFIGLTLVVTLAYIIPVAPLVLG